MARLLDVRIIESQRPRERLLEQALDELVDTLAVYDAFLPQRVRDRAVEARLVLEETRGRG